MKKLSWSPEITITIVGEGDCREIKELLGMLEDTTQSDLSEEEVKKLAEAGYLDDSILEALRQTYTDIEIVFY